jgi:uncharacterized protein (TIGR02646 family)
MKYIVKQEEPSPFVKWKIVQQTQLDSLITEGKSGDEIWAILPSSLSQEDIEDDYSKKHLRESLVQEQYYVCCYCNMRIKGKPLDTKVEHYLPKEIYRDKTFDYHNLMASCNGGERGKPVELSCDSYKGNTDPSLHDIISPYDVDAHSHFGYKENGEIYGLTTRGEKTINFLNLNCKRLKLQREKVIDQYLYDEEYETVAEVMALQSGKMQPFCMAVVFLLEMYR